MVGCCWHNTSHTQYPEESRSGGRGNMASHVEDKQSGRGGQDSAQSAGASSLTVGDWRLRNGEVTKMGGQKPGFFVCLIVIHFVRSASVVTRGKPETGRRLRYEVWI